ncbi:MAG: Gx transporter family protein [Clostridia bacterium]|nr:Gx transporter family protein [Clostridia bacterium]
MKTDTLKVARFGLLTALTLILSWLDRLVAPDMLFGIKLGLANTVLLFAIYTMSWEDCVLLMLVKVGLSGFLFSSPTVMIYSLAGSSLSLGIMLLIRKKPQWGALAALCAAAAVFIYLQKDGNTSSDIDVVWTLVLAGIACAGALVVFILICTGKMSGVTGTSLAGAVAHNTGQVLVASLILQTSGLLKSYLPVLVAIGGVVGCLTGIVAERVLKALHYQGNLPQKESPHEDE